MDDQVCTVWVLVLGGWVALYTACGLAWWRRERARRVDNSPFLAPIPRTAEEEDIYGRAL